MNFLSEVDSRFQTYATFIMYARSKVYFMHFQIKQISGSVKACSELAS